MNIKRTVTCFGVGLMPLLLLGGPVPADDGHGARRSLFEEIRRDRAELRRDMRELRRDRAELRRDLRRGAPPSEIAADRREVRDSLREVAQSRRELRRDYADLNRYRWQHRWDRDRWDHRPPYRHGWYRNRGWGYHRDWWTDHHPRWRWRDRDRHERWGMWHRHWD
ncbi:MAG TPA: hypothetical protein VNN77_16805 [candidate division Zixibacteria bacterium]|nr:hypothetical protein [candidate division Zixibacteria bacterium]